MGGPSTPLNNDKALNGWCLICNPILPLAALAASQQEEAEERARLAWRPNALSKAQQQEAEEGISKKRCFVYKHLSISIVYVNNQYTSYYKFQADILWLRSSFVKNYYEWFGSQSPWAVEKK
jgi:hypothetical protein